MSREELLAEILQLPPDERRSLIADAMHSLPEAFALDPDMTPELRAKLDQRHQDMIDHPENESTLDQVNVRIEAKFSFNQK